MIQADSQSLRAMFADPLRISVKAARETAHKALGVPDKMSEILQQSFGKEPHSRLEAIAINHRNRVATSPRKPDPPSDIERELKALAELTGHYADNIKKIWTRSEYMNLIQAEADHGWNETVESDTPFRWFPIYHETQDGILGMFDDDMRGLELEALKGFLIRVAQRAAEGKAPPTGKRETYTTRNEMLVRDLCHLVAQVGGAKAHVLPIARVIDEWATGEPVNGDFGSATLRRVCPHWPPSKVRGRH